MEEAEFLGLDVGMQRTGIARGSAMAKIAQPLFSVGTDELIDNLKTLIVAHKADAVVVGLPRNLKGDDTKQTDWVREWATSAKDKVKLPFYWQDEALTSVNAEAMQSKTKTKDIDSLAAAIILQDFLDSPEQQRILV